MVRVHAQRALTRQFKGHGRRKRHLDLADQRRKVLADRLGLRPRRLEARGQVDLGRVDPAISSARSRRSGTRCTAYRAMTSL